MESRNIMEIKKIDYMLLTMIIVFKIQKDPSPRR
jgi:hypothetical protein